MIKILTFSAWIVCAATLRCSAQDASRLVAAAGVRDVLRSELPPAPALHERGKRFEKSIRVSIYGEVRRPGVYYLPEGAVIAEAVMAAHGTTSIFAGWLRSTLVRLVDEKHAQIVDLRHGITEPEQMPLKEGDRLRLWGETY